MCNMYVYTLLFVCSCRILRITRHLIYLLNIPRVVGSTHNAL